LNVAKFFELFITLTTYPTENPGQSIRMVWGTPWNDQPTKNDDNTCYHCTLKPHALKKVAITSTLATMLVPFGLVPLGFGAIGIGAGKQPPLS
jgi:hypothetical protein